MKRYLQHMKTRPAHERRQHALRAAGVCTAFVFLVWITTLGLRLASSGAAQTAAAQNGAAGLQVATSSAGQTSIFGQ